MYLVVFTVASSNSRLSHYFNDYLEIDGIGSVKNCVQNFSDLIVSYLHFNYFLFYGSPRRNFVVVFTAALI